MQFTMCWVLSVLFSLFIICLEAQNVTPNSDNFFKPIFLGQISQGETIFIDVSRAIDVKFEGTGNKTFLYPITNSSSFQVHSKASFLSVSIPEHHKCRKILYLDEEYCVLRCADATILVELTKKKVVASAEFECFVTMPIWITTKLAKQETKEIIARLVCERALDAENYRVLDIIRSTRKQDGSIEIKLDSSTCKDIPYLKEGVQELEALHIGTEDALFWNPGDRKAPKKETEIKVVPPTTGTNLELLYISSWEKALKYSRISLKLSDLTTAILASVKNKQRRNILQQVFRVEHVHHVDVIEVPQVQELLLLFSVVNPHGKEGRTCEYVTVEGHVDLASLKSTSEYHLDPQTLRAVDILSTNKVCGGSTILYKRIRNNTDPVSKKTEIFLDLLVNSVIDKEQSVEEMISSVPTSRMWVRESHEGLFNLTMSYTLDLNKSFLDANRRTGLKYQQNSSILHPELTKGKPSDLGVTKIQGGMWVWGKVDEPDTGLMVWVRDSLDSAVTAIWYGNSHDQAYLSSNKRLYAVRDNTEVVEKIGSELLVFETNSSPYLTLDTNTFPQFSGDQDFELKLPYILNNKRVEETFQLRVLNSWDKLTKQEHDDDSLSNTATVQATQAVFPSIALRRNHWTQIPFDNKMVKGPYTRATVEGGWQYFFRENTGVVIVDKKGQNLPNKQTYVLDTDLVLQESNEDTYGLRLCIPTMLEQMKLVCQEPHLKFQIKGEIRQVYRTGTIVLIQSAAKHTLTSNTVHTITAVDSSTWSVVSSALVGCDTFDDPSAISITVFGNIVFYGLICKNQTVEVYDFHLQTKSFNPNLKAQFNSTVASVPKILCPKRLHMRKDREVKLVVFDQCDEHSDGIFIDLSITGEKRGENFRQVKSFFHHTPGKSTGNICAHRGTVATVDNGVLMVLRDDLEYLSFKIKLPELEPEGIQEIHCLQHGRMVVESTKLLLILDLDNITGERYHPYRKVDITKYSVVTNRIKYIFQDPEGLLIHYDPVQASGDRFAAIAVQYASPEIFVKYDGKDKPPEVLKVTFENNRDPKQVQKVSFTYKVEFVVQETSVPVISLKNPANKVQIQSGMLVKLFSHPKLTSKGDFWEISGHGDHVDFKAKLGLEVKPAIALSQTPANGVSSFAHSRGVIIYTTESEDRTNFYSLIDGHEALETQHKVGTYCVDSAMGHHEMTDTGKADSWAAVFACYNLHSSYLLFINSGKADVRLAEVDGYVLDPRVEITKEGETYIFGMMPYRDILYGYYSQDLTQVSHPFAMFLNLSYSKNSVSPLVHDYEVFKYENQVYLLYTTYKTYKVHLKHLKKPKIPMHPHSPIMMIDDKNDSECPDTDFSLIDGTIPHSFKCKVQLGKATTINPQASPHISCAFVFDSSHILLISFKIGANLALQQIGLTKLKLFGNFSAVKLDFDEQLLAVSGFFVAEPKDSKEDELSGGILVYDLSKVDERYGSFSGKLSARTIGFNPSSHNHHLQIIRCNQQSLVGVTDPQQFLKFYSVSEPALSFGDINSADRSTLQSVKLLVRGETGYTFIPLEKIFKLPEGAVSSDQQSFSSDTSDVTKPKVNPTDEKKQNIPDDHENYDVDVSIPETNQTPTDSKNNKGHNTKQNSKGQSILFYVLIIVILVVGGLRYYYWRQTKRITSVRYHDPKMHPQQDNEVFDKSI